MASSKDTLYTDVLQLILGGGLLGPVDLTLLEFNLSASFFVIFINKCYNLFSNEYKQLLFADLTNFKIFDLRGFK